MPRAPRDSLAAELLEMLSAHVRENVTTMELDELA